MNNAYIFGLLSVLLWSSVATAFKITLEYFSPVVMLFYSSMFSLFALFLILIFQKKIKLLFSYNRMDYLKMSVLGVINPFLYYLILFKAYELLPAQEAQPINYTWALTLTYLSVFILKQKISIYDFFAGIICYTGIVVISTHGDILGFEFTSLKGVFLALLSTLLWALYWVYNRKVDIDPVVGLFINFIVGFIAISLYITVFNIPLEFNIKGFLGSSYIGFFEMGFTFVLWLQALKLTDNSSKIANLIFLSPFISLIFIHFILKEKILFSTIVGLVFIVFGLLLQQKKAKLIKVDV